MSFFWVLLGVCLEGCFACLHACVRVGLYAWGSGAGWPGLAPQESSVWLQHVLFVLVGSANPAHAGCVVARRRTSFGVPCWDSERTRSSPCPWGGGQALTLQLVDQRGKDADLASSVLQPEETELVPSPIGTESVGCAPRLRHSSRVRQDKASDLRASEGGELPEPSPFSRGNGGATCDSHPLWPTIPDSGHRNAILAYST